MDVIILAGGQGKRLRPLTDYIPKPLIPINNIPIIDWQIRYLSQFGVKHVIISTGFKSEMIHHYLETRDLDIEITLCAEPSPFGTGGAIKFAAQYIGEQSVFVMNGDIITDLDMQQLGPDSIAAVPLRTKFGILDITDSHVVAFHEKQVLYDTWMNAGIYHLTEELISELPDKGNIEDTIFPKYASEKRLHVVQYGDARWHSIDSIKDIETVSTEIDSIIEY